MIDVIFIYKFNLNNSAMPNKITIQLKPNPTQIIDQKPLPQGIKIKKKISLQPTSLSPIEESNSDKESKNSNVVAVKKRQKIVCSQNNMENTKTKENTVIRKKKNDSIETNTIIRKKKSQTEDSNCSSSEDNKSPSLQSAPAQVESAKINQLIRKKNDFPQEKISEKSSPILTESKKLSSSEIRKQEKIEKKNTY